LLNPCVLDTTIASLMLARSPLLALYQPHLVNASLILSFQTVAEMRYGALKANWGEERSQNLEQFFTFFDLALYTDDLATHWAQIMFDARRAGRRLEAGDAWIAATASLLNAPLLTHDKDFSPLACPSVSVFCYA
jgi:tRNA(fMet)-specific endonuclease VapC